MTNDIQNPAPAETPQKKAPKPLTVTGTGAEQSITVISSRVMEIAKMGGITLPADYSADNAMKSAYLKLMTAADRNNKPALTVCTPESIVNALLDMVVQGLSPAKSQCYFIVFGNQLTLLRSYAGTVATAKRFGGVKDVVAQCIYEGDDFAYEPDLETGELKISVWAPRLENRDKPIAGAFAVVSFYDRPNHLEIMTMAEIRQAWGQGQTKGDSPAHKKFAQEMSKKTVINRACKMFINTSDDAAILAEAFNRTAANESLEIKTLLPAAPAIDEDVMPQVEALFGPQWGAPMRPEDTGGNEPENAAGDEEIPPEGPKPETKKAKPKKDAPGIAPESLLRPEEAPEDIRADDLPDFLRDDTEGVQ